VHAPQTANVGIIGHVQLPVEQKTGRLAMPGVRMPLEMEAVIDRTGSTARRSVSYQAF
jgi:hypothetical protein